VSIIDLPETPNTEALAAILALEMADRGTAMVVLVQADEADRIELVGHRLGRQPRCEVRMLLISREGRKIKAVSRATSREAPVQACTWEQPGRTTQSSA